MPSICFGSPLKPNLMFIRTPTAELCCHCTLSFSYPLQPLRLETSFASFLKHLQLSPVDFSVLPSLSHHIPFHWKNDMLIRNTLKFPIVNKPAEPFQSIFKAMQGYLLTVLQKNLDASPSTDLSKKRWKVVSTVITGLGKGCFKGKVNIGVFVLIIDAWRLFFNLQAFPME